MASSASVVATANEAGRPIMPVSSSDYEEIEVKEGVEFEEDSEKDNDDDDEGNKTSKAYSNKLSPYGSGETSSDNTKLPGGHLSAAVSTIDACSQRPASVEEGTNWSVQGMDAVEKMSSRMDLPQIRPRSISGCSELKDDTKRRAIVCEFYAKGWCVRGNSCRFLHIKDQGPMINHHKEEDIDKGKQKSDALTVEAGQNTGWIHGKRPGWLTTQMPHVSTDNPCSSRSQGGGAEKFGQKLYLNDYRTYHTSPARGSSPIFRSSTVNGSYSRSTDFSSYTGDIAETVRERSQFMLNDTNVADSSSSLAKSPFTSASARADFFGDWRPSVPFQPSYPITQSLLVRSRLYDPIHDSIEQTNSEDGLRKSAYSAEGASIQRNSLGNNDPVVRKTLGSEYSSNRQSTSDPYNSSSSLIKNMSEKGLLSTETDSGEKKWSSQQFKNALPKEEISSTAIRDKDTIGDNMSIDGDSGLRTHRSRVETEMRGEGGVQRNNTQIKDGDFQQPSKTLKIFHAALVEYVKELVKPFWSQGLMSKDAHKLIVKKAVDKVLGSLQPHQIPNSDESIKHFLSFSKSKLAKLVEACVDRYGKF